MCEEDCECFTCSLADFVDERYPDGIEREEAIEIMHSLADLGGFILADAGDKSFETFIALIMAERDRYRAMAKAGKIATKPIRHH